MFQCSVRITIKEVTPYIGYSYTARKLVEVIVFNDLSCFTEASTMASTNGSSGNSGSPDGGDGGSPGDGSQTGGGGGAGDEPGNLVQTTELITGPPRDPKSM